MLLYGVYPLPEKVASFDRGYCLLMGWSSVCKYIPTCGYPSLNEDCNVCLKVFSEQGRTQCI